MVLAASPCPLWVKSALPPIATSIASSDARRAVQVRAIKGVAENQKSESARGDTGCRSDVLTRMSTHTDETIASAVVLACLLIAFFATLFAAPLLFLLMHMGVACCTIAGP